jgi:hypothetical protein
MLIGKFEQRQVLIEVDVNEVFEEMSEGERCHMANKLYKEGYVPLRVTQDNVTLEREWDILEAACEFWKDEAIRRGYEE